MPADRPGRFVEELFKTIRTLLTVACVVLVAYMVYRHFSGRITSEVTSRLATQIGEVLSNYHTNSLSNDQRKSVIDALILKYDPAHDNLGSAEANGTPMKLEDILATTGVDTKLAEPADPWKTPAKPAEAK